VDESLGHLHEIADYVWHRWEVSTREDYIDEEESVKKPLENREAGAQLFKDAKAGKFDAVVMRTYPRLTTDVEEFFRVYAMFEEIGVPIIFVHDPVGLNTLAHHTQAKRSCEEGLRERGMAGEKAKTAIK
jgi:DNA invertase Pin-like site-specific DNA recombinase